MCARYVCVCMCVSMHVCVHVRLCTYMCVMHMVLYTLHHCQGQTPAMCSLRRRQRDTHSKFPFKKIPVVMKQQCVWEAGAMVPHVSSDSGASEILQ